MKRLSGLDASFLYLETPSTPMHTMGVLLLGERSPQLSQRDIESLLLDRMHHLPALRQRVVEVPFGLDHPVLVDDPDFDIRHHVVPVHWDEPGTLEDVDWAAGVLAARPLDRRRPLWQVWWFDNLEDGGSALIIKVHHAIIDGVSASLFMAQLLDTEPRLPSHPEVSIRDVPNELPRASTLALQAMLNQTRKSTAAVRGAIGMTRDMLKRRGPARVDSSAREPRRLRDRVSPRADFNGSLSTQRTISRASASLEEFRRVKKAFDTTINDVLLAAVTLALGRHFEANGGGPDRPLMAAVPVSTRLAGDELGGNRVSSLFVPLPIHLTRADQVIRSIRQETLSAKRTYQGLPFGFAETALDYAPPAAMKWFARQHERWRLADYHPPACNLIVSNFPGPPIPLYFAGAPVRAAYPFGPLVNGSGLNLTVMSYNGRMDLGLIACPHRMPHAPRFVSDLGSSVGMLCDAADRVGRRGSRLDSAGPRRSMRFVRDGRGISGEGTQPEGSVSKRSEHARSVAGQPGA